MPSFFHPTPGTRVRASPCIRCTAEPNCFDPPLQPGSGSSLWRRWPNTLQPASNLPTGLGWRIPRRSPTRCMKRFSANCGKNPSRISGSISRTAMGFGPLAKGLSQGTLPPSIGIRIKSFGQPTMARSVRTLELFVTALARAGGHGLTRLIVTLPKVSGPTQVEVLNDLLGALEHELGLPNHWLKIEVMIETPQALVAPSGEIQIRKLLAAAAGRCLGVHLGPYDYTASLNITASEQSLMHPACDFVRNVISVALSGTGVALADGPENMMPIGPHRAAAEQLTMQQRQQNWHAVHRAWSLSCRNIQHALSSGIFQGWDLHPAQLPARYGAVYSFFLRSLDSDALRLKTLIDKAAQARLLESVFDDAATGQGLLNSFRRAVQCGAISGQEAQQMTGLTSEELATRSFEKIVSARPSRSSPSS